MKKLLLILFLCASVTYSSAQCVTSILSLNGSCDSLCNGLVILEFQNGAMPYTITIFGPDTIGPVQATTVFTAGNLCPGTYDVQTIDFNNDTCNYIQFTVASGTAPDASVITTNATCTACSDGSATINSIIGGTPPFIYNWSNGATTQSITGLSPGVYNVWVTDANGCVDVDTFYIGVGANGYLTVGGEIYYDTNTNGIKDSGEPGVSNQYTVLSPGPVTGITNMNGEYAFVVGPGSYDIAYQPLPGWLLTSIPAIHNANVFTTSIGQLDFGIYPDSAYGEVTVSLSSNFPRCFWDVPYAITIQNTGFTILNGTINFTHDPALTFVSSSVIPVSQTGNQISYNLSNLYPGQTQSIIVEFTEPAGGTNITSTVIVDATDNVGNQLSDTTSLTQVVSCSYDPNDKQVNPMGIGALNYVSMDEWLTYQVRFQNTGTDTAFRVLIIDTLDAALDLNTFTLLNASHPVEVTTRTGNEVTFTFANILLPDSNVNEPNSHGYVLFRIKGLSSNPDPTSVQNNAYIYFDLNSPVLTNSTLTTFSDNFLGIYEVYENKIFELFPNPVSQSATLRVKDFSGETYLVSIIDVLGKVVIAPRKMNNGSMEIQKGALNSGMYLLKAQSVQTGEVVNIPVVIN